MFALCAVLLCSCGGSRGAAELTRTPTPWERLGQKIGEQEASALVTLRYGCEGCTRFVANELIVQPGGEFRVYDLTNRAERSHGAAPLEAMTTLRALLGGAEWKTLPEGQKSGTKDPPWLEIRAHGQRVRRSTPLREGQEPVLDRVMEALDAVMSTGR